MDDREDSSLDDDVDEEDDDLDEQFARIAAIVGQNQEGDLPAAVKVFCNYLQRSLTLPCEVTGVEDFRWEEYYVVGPGNDKEYACAAKLSRRIGIVLTS